LLNTTGDSNTANGAFALIGNTIGRGNTAVGTGALAANDGDPNIPESGSGNTAVGGETLFSNTAGSGNTAVGARALQSNAAPVNEEDSSFNTAVGLDALRRNTTGFQNTAIGAGTNPLGPTPSPNPAGAAALGLNTTGFGNTAVGASYLDQPGALGSNTTDERNTAVGNKALGDNTTGSENIALGFGAGSALTTGSSNIDIGNSGRAGESRTIRIGTPDPTPEPTPTPGGAPTGSPTPTPEPTPPKRTFIDGISGTAVVGDAVVVAGDGQLGTVASAARFKKDIRPMDKTSEAILAVRPVTFEYKSDSKGTPQFGLIAEEVAKVNPNLVVRDKDGQIYSVRYDAVNAMLLNEFLKEHQKVQDLEKQIEALTAGLQKVSAQLETSKAAPQVVNNP